MAEPHQRHVQSPHSQTCRHRVHESKEKNLMKGNYVTSSLMVTLLAAPGIKTLAITTLAFIMWKEALQTSFLFPHSERWEIKNRAPNQALGKQWWSPQGSRMTLMNPGSAQQHWDSSVRGCRESLNLMALTEGQKGKSGTRKMYQAGTKKSHSCHVRKGINQYSYKWDCRKKTWAS